MKMNQIELSNVQPATPELTQVSTEIVVLHDPISKAADALRGLQSKLSQFDSRGGATSFAVIGHSDGDGASFTAANLAVCFAMTGRRTALVDANLAAPRQMEMFSLNPDSPGLSNWIWGGEAADANYGATPMPNLFVVPAGTELSDPTIVQHTRFRDVTRDLMRFFDVIIFDSPASGDIANALSIAGAADQTVIVTRQNKTSALELRQLTTLIQQCHGEVVGVVMNKK